ncbi:hypothetical protein GCM10007857_64750 [Bradyrhizobium iriomotense]|uniref:Uncharacterized protein n=1 Tax=Bradyrhizobium iriomotense TaxID=441950 RepID=A0ABQ6B8D8_9BRAD|nr:hypothetical protein GCM10007857_64750 [Bradyrhizobium iriomotense]
MDTYEFVVTANTFLNARRHFAAKELCRFFGEEFGNIDIELRAYPMSEREPHHAALLGTREGTLIDADFSNEIGLDEPGLSNFGFKKSPIERQQRFRPALFLGFLLLAVQTGDARNKDRKIFASL